jgi:glycosyltransferase involved in cell wall biosynthesis
MRVALVHDWLVSRGGAERVLLEFHKLWPEAPIYTAAYDPEKFPEFAKADVRPLWLNRIELAKRKHQLFSIPRAWAFKSLDLSDFDLIVSSCSAESKYVKKGKALHICYCHTPIRYYWSDYEWYRQHPPFGFLNPVAKVILPVLLPYLRRMDYMGAQGVDCYVANSNNVKERIKKYYDRESTVIYPPVDVERFRKVAKKGGEYYLVFGRQVAYKRLDLVVDAFNELGLPLVVAGTGEEIKVQKPRARENIKFLDFVHDDEVPALYAGAKALIFPQEEDFGIVPVEAQAAGTPVIAFGKGGALETVVDGETGLFFPEQTARALMAAVKRFEAMKFDPAVLWRNAERFSNERFASEFSEYVESATAEHKLTKHKN